MTQKKVYFFGLGGENGDRSVVITDYSYKKAFQRLLEYVSQAERKVRPISRYDRRWLGYAYYGYVETSVLSEGTCLIPLESSDKLDCKLDRSLYGEERHPFLKGRPSNDNLPYSPDWYKEEGA